MSDMELLIWVLTGGYLLARWRIFKWQEARKEQRHDSR